MTACLAEVARNEAIIAANGYIQGAPNRINDSSDSELDTNSDSSDSEDEE